jgi:hypothetical protein
MFLSTPELSRSSLAIFLTSDVTKLSILDKFFGKGTIAEGMASDSWWRSTLLTLNCNSMSYKKPLTFANRIACSLLGPKFFFLLAKSRLVSKDVARI